MGKKILGELTSGDDCTHIDGLVGSCLESDVQYYMGYPIVSFTNLKEKTDNIYIIATTNPEFRAQIIELLTKNDLKFLDLF